MPQLRQPGVVDLQAYLKTCPDDTRKLFEKECSVMLECRVCRSIFRSFVNFCSHKRGFCRSEAHESRRKESSKARDDTLAPKKGASLRRTNLAKHVMKKVDVAEIPGHAEDAAKPSYVHTLPAIRREVIAVMGVDGTTQIHAPQVESSASVLDPDRVLLLRPQENPSRYRSMSLRLRLKEDATRVISTDEVECVERLMKYMPDVVEPTLGRCLYASCAEIAPFGNMQALAYHMCVKHHSKEKNGKAIPCLMCPKKFTSWKFFYAHLKYKHAHVKSEHIAYRKKEAEEYLARRKAKKLKMCLPGEGVRSRSLSPECSGAERDQRELDGAGAHDAENCSILQIGESHSKALVAEEIKEERVDIVAGCSSVPSPDNAQEESQPEHKPVKTKKARNSCTPPITHDSGEERHSSMSLRERRKRKMPARYRDDDILIPGLDEVNRSRRSPASTCLVERPSKAPTPPVVLEDLLMKDVAKVMNRLLSDVVDMSTREERSSTPIANVRTKSSRLRRRPDWMDNEDFVIVEDRKTRREGSSEYSVLPVFNHKDSHTSSTTSNEATPPPDGTPTKVANLNNVTSRSRRISCSPCDPSYSPSSRRKQNLNAVTDDVDDVTILSKYGKPGQPCDLAMVPVYLSGAQKHLFFSSLRQLDPNEPDGKHVCSQCKEVVPNLKEGRRHMVTHIRVMRLRCSLCGAGSFFCTDLRVHLMEGHCEKLHRAPEGVVNPNTIPCMTKEQADSLSELADPVNPGRVMYTSGQIVSAKSRTPYYPDPVIEERILGPGRIGRRSSPVRPKNRA
ncbi:hypothetical protein GCK32_007372 [Trichostrongylus colubriformis]|uniref:C2H2-type domain-containing protein n=2 Tax=Trichostrongylus colubriformis TaxID=6319 RepID=A0AAN8J354_TRICO